MLPHRVYKFIHDGRSNPPLPLSAAKPVRRCLVDPARRRLVESAGEEVASVDIAVWMEGDVEEVFLQVGSNVDSGVEQFTPEMGAQLGFLRRRPRREVKGNLGENGQRKSGFNERFRHEVHPTSAVRLISYYLNVARGVRFAQKIVLRTVDSRRPETDAEG